MSAVGRPRSFDHELARVMRDVGGLTYAEIAREFGVSEPAVAYACDPDVRAYRSEFQRERRAWIGTCIDCGGEATKNYNYEHRRGRCSACNAKAQTRSVRDDTLRCCACRQWLPDDAFPKGRSPLRRFRSQECRTCGTTRRRLARRAGRP